jgi:peptidoglycan/xylan/chitin deacetylase (PgdA/CDA1 family)
MKVPGFGRLKRYGRWSVNSIARPAVILLYHRVIDLKSDPQLLAVSRANFEQQMRFVRRRMTPLTLDRLVELSNSSSLPKNAVAVTFDDGYFDNLEFAAPILEKYEIPATVYIASGQIGQRNEFWWDELEAICLNTRRLPELCSLILGGKELRWNLGPSAENRIVSHDWNVERQYDSSPRHLMYRQLCALIRPLGMNDRVSIVQQLRQWSGHSGIARTTHRALTKLELIELARNPYVEIGGHTVWHPLLSSLSLVDQKCEIEAGKAELESILGGRIRSFAYPFGGSADYSAETAKVVYDSGFKSACANWFSWIKKPIDVFQLPRFLVRNWSGSELQKQLTACRGV